MAAAASLGLRVGFGLVLLSEGFGEASGGVGLGLVVQVAHGGLYVRVAHPLLQLEDRVGLFDGSCTEGVAQVVKAQPAQARVVESVAVDLADLVGVEVSAYDTCEYKIGIACEVLASAEACKRGGDIGDHRAERPLPDLGLLSPPSVKLRTPRMVSAPKSTSPQRSASSSPMRRPVNAAVKNSVAYSSLGAALTRARTSVADSTSISLACRTAGRPT